MTAFHRALTAFPITFDEHHKLQAWIRSCLSRSLKSPNHNFHDLMSPEVFMQVEAKVLNSASEF